MKLEKSKQSLLGFVLSLMSQLIGDAQASFLEKGMAVASLVRLGIDLSESLVKEAGVYRSLDVGKDWWILDDHPHIYAVRLDDKIWQLKEGGTTFTYMQTPGLSETLNLHIELDDSDGDVTAVRKHVVHLKIVYLNEGQLDYLWQLHQFTTRQVKGASSKQLLAESKEDCVIPTNFAPFFIYNPEK